MAHFCLESTGIYSEAISAYLFEQESIIVTVSNPAVIKSYGKSLIVRTKTDKCDADLIAKYAATVKPKPSHKPCPEKQQLKRLIRHQEALIKQKTQLSTKLEAAIDSYVHNSIKQLIEEFDKQINSLKKEIKILVENTEKIKKQVDLLKTIPGISDTTARLIIAEIIEDENNSKISRKAQVAHSGLAPMQKQSGTSVKGKQFICKAGNKRLRTCLYMPTLTATKNNPFIKQFYEKLVAKGKPKKLAIIACMRKLLSIAIGVLNNQQAFSDKWISLPPYQKNA